MENIEDNLSEWENPLECILCRSEMRKPTRLSCQHAFCRECIPGKVCPLCRKPIENELTEDPILSYIIESSREVTEVCGNCDAISQPMYFCETCQQPLCSVCRFSTHQAKIFHNHHIILLEERGRSRGRNICTAHSEPYILFCLESKKTMCIECFNSSSLERRNNFVNIDIAHKLCFDKLEKNTLKLKAFQEELKEHIEVRKRLLAELDDNCKTAATE